MATYLSSDMYLPALPTAMKELAISHQQIQLTLTAWFLGSISVQLFLGPLSDRYGRKTILCLGGALFSAATFICTIATQFEIFLFARFIQGMSICFMAVPGYASIHELFEQKEAIKILALMGSISVLAPAFGPLLGSFILLLLNWRWIFGFLVIWSLISFISLLIWMPETLPAEKRHPLKLPVILNTYWQIFTNLRFIATIVVFGLLFCAFITWIAAGPFLVMDQFKQSPIMFSIYQTIIFFSFIFSNYLVKKYIDHVAIHKLIRLGLSICFLTGIVAVMVTLLFPHFLFGMIGTYIIYAFGSGFAFAPLNRLVVESSKEPMGSRMAVFSMLISGFAALSSILVALFYNNSMLSLALIIFILMSLAMVVMLFLNKTSSALSK